MAQTKKSWQDYLTASFGEHAQVKPGTNSLEIGAAAQGGGAFERLPIGTSAIGTAVLVDLIGAETFSVSVGTITTLVAGTLLKVGTVNYTGTLNTMVHGTQELLGTANYVGTLGTIVGTLANVGTLNSLGTLGILGPYSAYHYTLGSGTIKTAAGFVHAVTINTNATAKVELFDSNGTSGNTVASYQGTGVGSYLLDVTMGTGITIASTIAAVCDITVSYK